MSALSIQPTFPIFTETDGQPLENGYIWIGTVNLDPQVNPINVYWDAALTIAAPQPIRTLNGYPSRNGTPGRLYVNSDYSIRVMNRNGSTVYSAPAATERYSNPVIDITLNASDVIYDPAGAGAVQTTAQTKLREFVSVEDFGVATTNTAAQNSTYAQAAIDFASANGKCLVVNGMYEIDYPLVIQGNSGGYTSGGFTIRGAAGQINCGFRKNTHTTHAGVDTIIYLALPPGATYTSDITISNLWLEGDINGDQRTDLVDFAIYAPSPISTVVIEDCSLSAKTCIDFYNAFIYTIRRVNMWPKNKGIRIQSGTTGRIEECFVQSALLIAYELWGEYSSIASCACDGAEGVAYYFRGGSWQAGGLGCESTGLAQQVVYVREAQVSIDGMRIHHPAGEFVTVFYSEVSAHLRVSNVSFGNFTGNTTAAGYLYQVATSSTIELSNITLSAKPFKYASAVSTSCTQRLKNIGPISGDASKFGNLYPIAGQTYGDFDQFLGAGSSVKGAAIYFGGSDTNPAADATIRFDDGVPLHSIILNTRGSVAATYGWICTATAATISASTFVAWV